MTKERLKQAKGERVVVRLQDGETSKYLLVDLNSNISSPLKEYLLKSKEEVQERLSNVDDEFIKVRTKKSHGRLKRSSVIRQERESKRQSLTNQLGRLSEALRGNLEIPIEVDVVDGEFKGVSLGQVEKGERWWWKFVLDEDLNIEKIEEIDENIPTESSSLSLLRRMYVLRWRMKHSSYTQEIKKAKTQYARFMEDYKQLPDKKQEKLTPFVVKVRDSIED